MRKWKVKENVKKVEKTEVSKIEAQNIIKRRTVNGTLNNCESPGRPPKLSVSDKQHLKLSSLRNKRKSSSTLF